MFLKLCFPLPWLLHVVYCVSLVLLKENVLLSSKVSRLSMVLIYLLDPKLTRPQELIFLFLFTQSQWFLSVPWGNRICCPFPGSLDVLYSRGEGSSWSPVPFLSQQQSSPPDLPYWVRLSPASHYVSSLIHENLMEVHEEKPQSGYEQPYVHSSQWFWTLFWLLLTEVNAFRSSLKFGGVNSSYLPIEHSMSLPLILCNKLASACKPFPLGRGEVVLWFQVMLSPCDLSSLCFRKVKIFCCLYDFSY